MKASELKRTATFESTTLEDEYEVVVQAPGTHVTKPRTFSVARAHRDGLNKRIVLELDEEITK